MATNKTFRIGIISGSVRVRRSTPQVATFVRQTIKASLADSKSSSHTDFVFDDIDVASLGLPANYDEPNIPSQLARVPDDYEHEHTRAWSRRVLALDAFVFVTPQYNWGVPAGLKNAIDYLFKEWRGKPFMVVSFGGHGGGQAAAALQLILGSGINMRALDHTVNLTFPSRDVLVRSALGQDLGLDGTGEKTGEEAAPWHDRRADIVQAWQQMVAML